MSDKAVVGWNDRPGARTEHMRILAADILSAIQNAQDKGQALSRSDLDDIADNAEQLNALAEEAHMEGV